MGFYICATEAHAHPLKFIKILPVFFLPTFIGATSFSIAPSVVRWFVYPVSPERLLLLWNFFTWCLVTPAL